MTITIRTLEVTGGEFKGKTVQSYEMPVYIEGLSTPYVPCFDDEGNEYTIFWGNLKEISREEVDAPEELESLFNEFFTDILIKKEGDENG